MSEVYQNAICNIAGTGAMDSTGGLFFDRDPKFAQPCKVSLGAVNSTLCVLGKYIPYSRAPALLTRLGFKILIYGETVLTSRP